MIVLWMIVSYPQGRDCGEKAARWWCCYWKPQWRNLHRANHRRREGRRDGGEYAGGGLCAVKPEGNVPSHGRGDRETEQAAGQDRRQDGRRRRQHRQGQREDTEIAEVDYLDAQSNSSYRAHYLKDSRICWLGLLRKTMVVKSLYVETIVPLKDLNAFKQKCFHILFFYRQSF